MWLDSVVELIESFEILKSQCFLYFLRCSKISKCFTLAIWSIAWIENWFITFLYFVIACSLMLKQILPLIFQLLLFVEFHRINRIGSGYHFSWVMFERIHVSSLPKPIISFMFRWSYVRSTLASFFFYIWIFTRH
jgi:hypothetical protein